MKIKKGDLVKVISGPKDRKGKIGKVLEVFSDENRVKIEGVGRTLRHVKPQSNKRHPEGGIVEDLPKVHVSNVMFMSQAQNRPVRVGYSVDADGKKSRVARGRNVTAEKLEGAI